MAEYERGNEEEPNLQVRSERKRDCMEEERDNSEGDNSEDRPDSASGTQSRNI